MRMRLETTCRIQNPDIPWAGRVGEPGGAAGQGRARLRANGTIWPGTKVHRIFQSIEDTSLQRFSRNTNKRNSMYTDGKTKPTVDHRFISGLSAGPEAFFVPCCRTVEHHLFVFGNPFHAGHVGDCKLHWDSTLLLTFCPFSCARNGWKNMTAGPVSRNRSRTHLQARDDVCRRTHGTSILSS